MPERFIQNSGKTLLIDEIDLPIYMGNFPWHDNGGYIMGTIQGRRTSIHGEIGRLMNLTGTVDHEDHNPYNNQRYNLRSACAVIQSRNQGIYKNNTSGHTGVSFDTKYTKWRVTVSKKYIGRFTTYAEAVEAQIQATKVRDAAPIVRILGLPIRKVIENETPKPMIIRSGETVWVSHDDFPYCLKYAWNYDKHTNIIAGTSYPEPKLHRFIAEMMGILEFQEGDSVVDHKHGDPFDCTRQALRLLTYKTNPQNVGVRSSNTSGTPNIYYDSANQKWFGQIRHKGITYRTKSYHYNHDAQNALDVLLTEVNPEFRREHL